MRERPILFNGVMVRAILDGRKTQTRRVCKFTPSGHLKEPNSHRRWHRDDPNAVLACPKGQPGDRLWVRETWVECLHTSPATDEPMPVTNGDRLIEHATKNPNGRWNYDGRVICYRATSDVEFCDGDGFAGEFANREDMPRWRPNIHMPRWASRITLEITGVRLERVQSINAKDAGVEGVQLPPMRPDDPRLAEAERMSGGFDAGHCQLTINAFRDLWDSINAKRGFGWDENPWVWVIEFRRIDAAIAAARKEGE